MTNAVTAPEMGVIVFAHGSRDAQWRLPIEAVANQIRQRPNLLSVRCAYLELCEPDLATATLDLIAAGALKFKATQPQTLYKTAIFCP